MQWGEITPTLHSCLLRLNMSIVTITVFIVIVVVSDIYHFSELATKHESIQIMQLARENEFADPHNGCKHPGCQSLINFNVYLPIFEEASWEFKERIS